jgi:hypothetical protein
MKNNRFVGQNVRLQLRRSVITWWQLNQSASVRLCFRYCTLPVASTLSRHSWLLDVVLDYRQWNVLLKVKLSLWFNWAPRSEGVLGDGGIDPRIPGLGTRWRWVVSFTPQPIYPQGKSFWNSLGRRLGGFQNWYGRGGEERNSDPLPGLQPPTIQPVSQRCTTEVSWLRNVLLANGNLNWNKSANVMTSVKCPLIINNVIVCTILLA